LQSCLGGWRVNCGGDTWRLVVGRDDASNDVSMTSAVTQGCGPAPVDPVHRSTVDQTKGYEVF
jgi:hypothetical protein